jgi:hypothetical protein
VRDLEPRRGDAGDRLGQLALLDELGLDPAAVLVGRRAERAGPVADAVEHVRGVAQRLGQGFDGERRVREDQVLLRREVAEDGGAGDVRGRGDVVDRRAREATLGEEPHRGLVDRRARRPLLAFPQSGHVANPTTRSIFRLS